jgi:malonyl-CoA/methylmalonyl-CoA synthetase
METNLFQLFDDAYPDKGKVVIETAAAGRINFEDIVHETGRYANALLAGGAVRGDRVAVQVEKSVEALVLYLACLRAGIVFLPLNTAYTLAELDYFIRDAEPAIVVCDPARRDALAPVMASVGGRIETLDGSGSGTLPECAAAQSDRFETVEVGPEELAAILYTSGTTGRSKGAMLTHCNLASNALVLRECWRFQPEDVLLHMLPIYHAHGLFVATNVTLIAGASMIFLPRFDSDEAIGHWRRASVMMGVPTFYTRLLQTPLLSRSAASGMRLFISGSAPLLAETHREWQDRTEHAILERYGMTETGMNTSNPYVGDRIAGTVGFPLPGVEIRVSDPETGGELGHDEIGMLEVRGPNVFKGYWRMADKTKSEFRDDGFFITGDLAKIDARGYVHLVGRGKDLVISGGFNVYPKEVETEIDAMPGVLESAVIGVPHPDFGEGVTAVVVLDGTAEVGEDEIRRQLEHRLAKFKLPKRVLFADELPRNTMGKVQKNILREKHAALYAST